MIMEETLAQMTRINSRILWAPFPGRRVIMLEVAAITDGDAVTHRYVSPRITLGYVYLILRH